MSLKNLFHTKISGCDLEQQSNLLTAEAPVLFEDILNRGLSLRVKVTGRSMASFLRGGELLTIRKATGSSLHIGDLIFFKTVDGSLQLHRIVKKQLKDNTIFFQTKGDALRNMDNPVCEYDVLGKVCKIEKIVSGGKTKQIDLESGMWKSINYVLALISLGKSKTYSAFVRSVFYLSFRSIKRVIP